MKKKYFIIAIVFLLIISIISSIVIAKKLKDQKEITKTKEIEQEQEEKIKNATIIVDLKEDLTTKFYSKVKVSEFITNINGTITDDYYINTEKIGPKTVEFTYINDENITIPYQYEINIVDNIPPVVWLGSSYSVNVGYNGSLTEDIMCGDNYDDNPTCNIIGNYNFSVAGAYPLTYEAIDSSNNKTIKSFTLYVNQPKNNSSSSSNNPPKRTNFTDVIKNYKTEKTKIGIDVSKWQEDIDFDALKAAGVEFAFIRVGGTRGIDGEYFLDNKFKQNIEGFNRVNIPVGIYFYSYAKSSEAAIADAKWVVEQIKDYKIDLPIAYDWENWSFYNEFNNSFYTLTKNAEAFLDVIKDNGYDGLLYSSKNFLEQIWLDIDYPTWLAHYTTKTSYAKDYKFWQMCSNGLVDGINGNVDIDIMYE